MAHHSKKLCYIKYKLINNNFSHSYVLGTVLFLSCPYKDVCWLLFLTFWAAWCPYLFFQAVVLISMHLSKILVSLHILVSSLKVNHATLINHDGDLLHGAVLEKLIFAQMVWFHVFYEIESLMIFTRASQWTLSWASWIQSTPSHPISLRFLLILCTYACIGFPRGLFSVSTATKILSHPNNICWRVQIMKLLSPS
jgi:hypothetical protein